MAKVSVRQCMADIRINDVPLIRKNVDADLTVEIPINYLIEYSGRQDLMVQIYPQLGKTVMLPGVTCSVEIWRYDGSGFKIIPIEQVCASSLSVSEEDVTRPSMYEKRIFLAEVSYHITRWSNCEEIKDSRKIAPVVAEYYQKIGKLLADKQYTQYMEYVRNRERNICTALSLDEKETKRRNEMLFECLDGGFVLQPMRGGKIHFYANKRVATVLNKDMKSILQFANEETGEVLAIELLLGIKKGAEKICII